MRFIESDENLALRGAALAEAIKDDLKLGLVPFWVSLVIIKYFFIYEENNMSFFVYILIFFG